MPIPIEFIRFPTAAEMEETRRKFPVCYQVKDSETGKYYFLGMMTIWTIYGIDEIIAQWKFKNKNT